MKIIGGESTENSIAFRSDKFEVIIKPDPEGYRKTVYEMEIVKISIYGTIKNMIKQHYSAVLIMCSICLLLKLLYTPSLTFYTVQIIALIIFYLSNVANNFHNDNIRKNHAAEHMVISAYDKLLRIPTKEETKKQSRIHIHCGGMNLSFHLITQIVLYIVFVMFISDDINIYLLLICTVFIIISYIFKNNIYFNFIGTFLQKYITTKEPDDKHIKIALLALTELIKEHENIENSQPRLSAQ